MATRSAIAVTHGDIVKGVYCHWDGYIDHNGRILLEHYNSAKANNLVALGDISSLGAEIGEKHQFGVNDELVKSNNWTTFYGRDRGETGTEWHVFKDAQEFIDYFDGCGCEYFYLIHDGIWYVSQYGRAWERLDEAVQAQNDVNAMQAA